MAHPIRNSLGKPSFAASDVLFLHRAVKYFIGEYASCICSRGNEHATGGQSVQPVNRFKLMVSEPRASDSHDKTAYYMASQSQSLFSGSALSCA